MRNFIIGAAALSLAACGSDVQEPIEQIVVREPGEAAPAAADEAEQTESDAQVGQSAE